MIAAKLDTIPAPGIRGDTETIPMTNQTDDAGPGEDATAPETDATQADDGAAFEPRLETLRGDLRDVMLSRVRTARKPWEKMTEAEQTDFANGLDLAAGDIIRRMVRLMTSFEWPHVAVMMGEVKIKGEKGIEAKIACPNVEPNRSVLGDHAGKHCMVLMVDSDTFMAERAPVDIRPDQPSLDLEDGEGVPDPAEPELPIDEPGPELEPANQAVAADLE